MSTIEGAMCGGESSLHEGDDKELWYRAHPRWSYQLHHDNLRVQARVESALRPVPSRVTLSRYMKAHGMVRSRSKKNASQIARGLLSRETRSYEVAPVGGLFHWDFHTGSRRVLCRDGQRMEVRLLGILDDYSRVGCYLQWGDRGVACAWSIAGVSEARALSC